VSEVEPAPLVVLVVEAVDWLFTSDALVLLVCEVVEGTVAPGAVVALAVVVSFCVLWLTPVSPVAPLGVVLCEAVVLGCGVVVLPLAVTEPEALGVVVLPAVVDGPLVVAEAVVPGAVAEVLLEVEAVPVCAAVPEAVVVLPGLVVAVLGLLVEVGELLTVLLLWVLPVADVVFEAVVEP
jgi:hypothetical protein